MDKRNLSIIDPPKCPHFPSNAITSSSVRSGRNIEITNFPYAVFFYEYVIESYNQKMATYLEETCVLDGRNGTLYLKYDVTLFIA